MATVNWLKSRKKTTLHLQLQQDIERKRAEASDEENVVLKHDPNDKSRNLQLGSQALEENFEKEYTLA